MRNSTISANTLFHFTSSKENIRNILTYTFSPRYCLEHIDFLGDDMPDIAIPMVCFCDIPLSQVTEHVDTYGKYAIGLSKDWAIRNGISPVFYVYRDSRTNAIFDKLSKSIMRLDKIKTLVKGLSKEEIDEMATLDILELLSFCKIYKGRMWRKGKLSAEKIFYNEREWRYVPKINELNEISDYLFLSKELFDNEEKRSQSNFDLQMFKIPFNPSDIKYIIVSEESERLEMIDMIEHIKGNNHSFNSLKVLNSKIISIDQIKDDF